MAPGRHPTSRAEAATTTTVASLKQRTPDSVDFFYNALGNCPEGGKMPTYIMISTLTPEGVQTVKNNPNRIKEVNQELEQIGAKVVAQWATLGRFDFVNVVEAPDEKTMAKVSMELGSRGTAHYESLPAIPIDEFIDSM
jgi:uncharacterized protein with GYD domain